jgi:hypothetical protein
MVDRWRRELRRLSILEPDDDLLSRAHEGPRPDLEVPTNRSRLLVIVTALAVFAAAGWFAWAALRPDRSTVGSTGSGTYILSDFVVSAQVDRATEEVDHTQVEVTFAMRWSSTEYPGAHSCVLRVFDPSGAEIGSASVELDSLMRNNSSSMPLPVTGLTEGATATGSCGPERLDTPIAYDISDVHLMSDLTVSYVAGWPDKLEEGEYPGTNACTVALFENGGLISKKHLTLAVGDQQEVTSTRFNEFDDQIVLVPLASLEATVACEPYVQEGVHPDPTPPAAAMEPANVARFDCGGEGPDLLTPEVQVQNDGVLIHVEDLADAVGVEGSLVDEDPGTGTWAVDFGEEDQGSTFEFAMAIAPGQYVVRCAHGGFLAGELSAAEGSRFESSTARRSGMTRRSRVPGLSRYLIASSSAERLPSTPPRSSNRSSGMWSRASSTPT